MCPTYLNFGASLLFITHTATSTVIKMADAKDNFLPRMDWDVKDTNEALATFKRRSMVYFRVKIPREEEVHHIVLYSGDRGQKKIKSKDLTEEDMKNPDKVWEALGTEVKSKTNMYVDRLRLRRIIQRDDESNDEFLNRCDTQAGKYKFAELEREQRIVEQFMDGIYSNELQKQLLMEGEEIKLSKAIDMDRSHEATIRDHREMRARVRNDVNFDAVEYLNYDKTTKPCIKCGRIHKNSPHSCPPYGCTV